MPSRGLVHPRTRAGGGARWIQVPAVAGTQETMGEAGTQRSEVESPWRVSFPPTRVAAFLLKAPFLRLFPFPDAYFSSKLLF